MYNKIIIISILQLFKDNYIILTLPLPELFPAFAPDNTHL